jgi:hypothetical protein
VREAEEIEGLGLSLSTSASILGRKRAELDQARLVGMQRQAELAKPLGQLCPELFGIGLVLESNDDVVSRPV